MWAWYWGFLLSLIWLVLSQMLMGRQKFLTSSPRRIRGDQVAQCWTPGRQACILPLGRVYDLVLWGLVTSPVQLLPLTHTPGWHVGRRWGMIYTPCFVGQLCLSLIGKVRGFLKGAQGWESSNRITQSREAVVPWQAPEEGGQWEARGVARAGDIRHKHTRLTGDPGICA